MKMCGVRHLFDTIHTIGTICFGYVGVVTVTTQTERERERERHVNQHIGPVPFWRRSDRLRERPAAPFRPLPPVQGRARQTLTACQG